MEQEGRKAEEASATRFDERLRRLARFRPFENQGKDLRTALARLLLAAAEGAGGGFETVEGAREHFLKEWDLEVEISELEASLDWLETGKAVERLGQGFRLPDEIRAVLQEREEESQRVEAKALSDWEVEVRKLRVDLDPADLTGLREDLELWLAKIVARHGAEAALLLYPEDEQAQRVMDQIDTMGTRALPNRSERVMAIRRVALWAFVRRPTGEQRKFLANRLDTAFYLTVLTLGPEATELVEAAAQGTTLYLDTNVLYGILGMAGPDEVRGGLRLVELSRELGYRVAVTPWTVEEMRTSIQNARREFEIYGVSNVNEGVASLMVRATGEKGPEHAVWEKALQGLMPGDFFDQLDGFEDQLRDLGIEVVADQCASVEGQASTLDDYGHTLRTIVDRRQDRAPRPDEVIQHDCRHRLLVEDLRQGAVRFSEANSWFLTQSTNLVRFAKTPAHLHEDPPRLPFCVTPSTWIQIIRSLKPRTADYENMVVGLLTSPYVGWKERVDQRGARAVVARADSFDGASLQSAYNVIQNGAIMEEVGAAETADEAGRRVQQALREEADRLEREKARSAELLAAEAEELQREKERADSLKQDLEATARARESETARREGLERDLERRSKEHDDAIQRETRKREDLERRHADERARRRAKLRWALAFLLIAGAIGAGIGVLATGLVTGALGVTVVLAGCAGLVGVAIFVAFGHRRGGSVIAVIGLVVSVAAVVLPLVLEK